MAKSFKVGDFRTEFSSEDHEIKYSVNDNHFFCILGGTRITGETKKEVEQAVLKEALSRSKIEWHPVIQIRSSGPATRNLDVSDSQIDIQYKCKIGRFFVAEISEPRDVWMKKPFSDGGEMMECGTPWEILGYELDEYSLEKPFFYIEKGYDGNKITNIVVPYTEKIWNSMGEVAKAAITLESEIDKLLIDSDLPKKIRTAIMNPRDDYKDEED